MRCAIDFDENKPLIEQEVKAWGEMQSIEEEPCYIESDIKDECEKEFFRGYKFACDNMVNVLDNFVLDKGLDEETSHEIQKWMSGELCMLLFSILDEQDCEEDDDE